MASPRELREMANALEEMSNAARTRPKIFLLSSAASELRRAASLKEAVERFIE